MPGVRVRPPRIEPTEAITSTPETNPLELSPYKNGTGHHIRSALLAAEPHLDTIIMAKKATIPDSAIIITTFAELIPWIKDFRAGKFNCLIILSSPGLLKSTSLIEIVGRADDDKNPGRGVWIEGNDSAFVAHCRIWEKMGDPNGPKLELLVIDDVDEWDDPRSRKYLKALLNTEPVKWPSWDTAAAIQMGVKGKFPVSCKVCWLANEFRVKSVNHLAIFERGICLYFCPPAAELHAEIERRAQFNDQEIMDFIRVYLPWITRPTARHYYHALEIKNAEKDWQGWLLQQWFGGDKTLIGALKLLRDPAFPTNKKRAAEFVHRKYGSERTYYNKLKELGGADKIAANLHTPAAGCKTEKDFKLAPNDPPVLGQLRQTSFAFSDDGNDEQPPTPDARIEPPNIHINTEDDEYVEVDE
jgi:hypothetical protein